MHKITPNPPETENVSLYGSLDSNKLHETAQRALDHYLTPPLDTSRVVDARTVNIFAVVPDLGAETLLANASETLVSAIVMAGNLAFDLKGADRSLVLAIHQMMELGLLLVNEALEQVAPVE